MRLPMCDFKWIDPSTIPNHERFILSLKNKSDKGYLFDVDLSYPSTLHKKHKHFPLAPHSLLITYDDLSPYAKETLLHTGGNESFKCQKLVASFLPKKNYVVHYKNLKLYLSLGMKIDRVNKILEFTQKKFLKPYIDKCTVKRQQATNKFDKNMFKLMCNSGIKHLSILVVFNL